MASRSRNPDWPRAPFGPLKAQAQARRDLLAKLGDNTLPDAALAIFRPSFGRRASSSTGTGAARSEFGEFDAILGTSQATYLIESKWDGSSELRNGKITLGPAQLHRHVVFQWYLKMWKQCGPMPWKTFVSTHGPAFAAQFASCAIAPESSKRLTPNLAVKPSTVLITKVTIKGAKQAVQMFGPAQSAVAKAVADSVASGVIPKNKAEDLVIVPARVGEHEDNSEYEEILPTSPP